MKGILLLCAATLLVVAPARVAAQGASDSKKVITASGTVSAVSATALTVKGKTEEMTFTIDDATKVTGTGAGTKNAALKEANKPRPITEFVKVGDVVRVRYHDAGATKHAADVRVTKSAPVK